MIHSSDDAQAGALFRRHNRGPGTRGSAAPPPSLTVEHGGAGVGDEEPRSAAGGWPESFSNSSSFAKLSKVWKEAFLSMLEEAECFVRGTVCTRVIKGIDL